MFLSEGMPIMLLLPCQVLVPEIVTTPRVLMFVSEGVPIVLLLPCQVLVVTRGRYDP